ncbi:ABC transporter ATP-binding protein [Pseudomonas syringae]|uniref:ABC transporter ATP-binding protein n=1 Tax=Pseudomonas syringae TaxID=317 RepID=A0A085V7N9_PSESX|nr:ABC transporter ATP-binding protein [Pseudomonas syringae]KFE51452.1 ABC transporter ATP-binding protein [Pseudomonas syringae]
MSSDISIKVENLSKCYQIYDRPQDRFKQFFVPRLQRALGFHHKQLYREFRALDKISFTVKKGETVGIVGRNGSGKSTLLQMICGTLHPTGGSVQTFGRVAALLELGSGFNPEFSGRENIYMNGSILGLTNAEIEDRFDAIVEFADIGNFIEQPVKTYSSGMMLRLAFAVIAHVDADILIIDEALAVGDAFFTQKCMRFLRTFMKTGTVLFVSHDTSSVRALCNKAIWLEKGKVLKQGSPKVVCDEYLEAFYEAQQGSGTTTRLKVTQPEFKEPGQDQRQSFINASNLRNDLELFEFNPDAPSFGKGHAQITNVIFLDTENQPLSWVVGGEKIKLKIVAVTDSNLQSPIIGFHIKDKLGQALFGDNTYLTYAQMPVPSKRGSKIVAEFTFVMPRLAKGDYSVSVAIANGTQQDHIQNHWIHDAVFFKSESTSVAAGLIGIPMSNIELKTLR